MVKIGFAVHFWTGYTHERRNLINAGILLQVITASNSCWNGMGPNMLLSVVDL